MRVAVAVWHLAVCKKTGHLVTAKRYDAVNQRHVDILTFAGAVAVHSPFFELDTWVSNIASLWLLALAGLCVGQAWLRWRTVERAIRAGTPMPGFGSPAFLAAAVGVLVGSVAVGVLVVALR